MNPLSHIPMDYTLLQSNKPFTKVACILHLSSSHNDVLSDFSLNMIIVQFLSKTVGAIAVGSSFFGVATTDILMDDVDCDGSETSLLQCNYDSSHNCNYENSASIACSITEQTGCV